MGRLLVFASGDFAFNLFWQSVTLYLLYYYTEVERVPVALASTGYALASVWDGIASLAIGHWLHRRSSARVPPRGLLAVSAVPLGLSFVLAYVPPDQIGIASAGAFGWVLAGHLLFRTLYALTNIPYLAMSARISADAGERARVAGARMLAGTIAAVAVALGTVPVGRLLAGCDGAPAFVAAAASFALVASVLLLAVALLFRDAVPAADRRPRRPPLLSAWRDPAFGWFAVAVVTMIVPVTMIDRSMLYYFTYNLHDPARGRLTLGAMMAVNAVAIPAWLALSRRVGLRAVWGGAIATCLAALVTFVALDPAAVLPVQLFLLAMQAGTIGLNFAMWALLPEILDRGRRAGEVDAEAVAYGWLALLQRLASGLGTLLLGLGFGAKGIGGGQAWLRASLTLVPLGFLIVSGALVLGRELLRRPAPAPAA